MTPRAPPAPLLPEEETGKYSCYHTSSETQRWEKEGGSGGAGVRQKAREIKKQKSIINHTEIPPPSPQNPQKQLQRWWGWDVPGKRKPPRHRPARENITDRTGALHYTKGYRHRKAASTLHLIGPLCSARSHHSQCVLNLSSHGRVWCAWLIMMEVPRVQPGSLRMSEQSSFSPMFPLTPILTHRFCNF